METKTKIIIGVVIVLVLTASIIIFVYNKSKNELNIIENLDESESIIKQAIDLSGWNYYQVIDINTTVSSNLTNFPALVYLNTSNSLYWNTTNCSNVRFVDSTNSSFLNYEIEICGNATTNGIFWVQGNYTGGVLNRIYAYLGNINAIGGENVTRVWDKNYIAVFHMKEASGANLLNSSSNSVVTSQTNSPTQRQGTIDGSIFYDGTEYHNTTISSGLSSSFTYSLWVNYTTERGIAMALESDVASYSNYWSQIGPYNPGHGLGDEWDFSLYDGTNNPNCYSTTTAQRNVWTHLGGVRNTATDRLLLYQNGDLKGNVTDTTTSVPTYSKFYIGAQISQANRYFYGHIDEVRVSNIARSGDWIKAEYSQNYTSGSIYLKGTCTYSGSGNWTINCNDNCSLNTNTNLNNNWIIFTNASGSGNVNILANISNSSGKMKYNNCNVTLWNGGGFR